MKERLFRTQAAFIVIYVFIFAIFVFLGSFIFQSYSKKMELEFGDKAIKGAYAISGGINTNKNEINYNLSLSFEQYLHQLSHKRFAELVKPLCDSGDIINVYFITKLPPEKVKYYINNSSNISTIQGDGIPCEYAYAFIYNKNIENTQSVNDSERYIGGIKEIHDAFINKSNVCFLQKKKNISYITGIVPYYDRNNDFLGFVGVDISPYKYIESVNNFLLVDVSIITILIILSFFVIQFINKRTQHNLYRDNMTGLYNRKYYKEVIKRTIAKSPNSYGIMLYINIRRFKKINETLGHEYGDQLIIEVSNRLREFKEKKVILSHIAADEFVVYIHNVEIQSIEALAYQILSIISEPYNIAGNIIKADFTCGISIFGQDAYSADDLIEHSEFAMSCIRAREGQSLGYYSMDKHLSFKKTFERRRKLPELIKSQSFYPVFQPIVSLKTGEIFGYEALSRLTDESYGSIVDAVQDARASGLTDLLDATLTKIIADGYSKYRKSAKVFINHSPNFIPTKQDFAELLGSLKDKNFVIEITEYDNADFELLKHKIAVIRSLGGMVAIDDFGSGYANELALLSMHPDLVKIDKELVTGVDTNENKQLLIQNIVKYSKSNGIIVLAEGIETYAELKTLIDLNVDLGQGKFIGLGEKEPPESIERKVISDIIKANKESTSDSDIKISNENKTQANIKFNPNKICSNFNFINIQTDIQQVIEKAGKTLNLNRIYIFEKVDNGKSYSHTFEWVSQGFEPLKDSFAHIPVEFMPSVEDILENDGIFAIEDTSKLPGNIHPVFKTEDAKSIVILPIFIGEKTKGFIGFDDCIQKRIWQAKEFDMLYQFSYIISLIYTHYDSVQNINNYGSKMQAIADNINYYTYVSDIETYRLLYVSESLKQKYPNQKLEGEICWKVLHEGFEGPCPFCPRLYLFDDKGNPIETPYTWEFSDILNKRKYAVTDKLIKWIDGKFAHMQTASDITQINLNTSSQNSKD